MTSEILRCCAFCADMWFSNSRDDILYCDSKSCEDLFFCDAVCVKRHRKMIRCHLFRVSQNKQNTPWRLTNLLLPILFSLPSVIIHLILSYHCEILCGAIGRRYSRLWTVPGESRQYEFPPKRIDLARELHEVAVCNVPTEITRWYVRPFVF